MAKEKSFWRREVVLRVERQLGEFLLIIGSLLAFKGIEPYLDLLKLNDAWWIFGGFIVVGLAVNRLVSYEKKLKMTEREITL